jgi:cation transport regulator ChaB
MVTLNIKTNFSNVQRQLDAMRKDIATKALASALNKTTEQGRTEMSRQIRAEFNITAAKVREKLFVRKATFAQGRFGLSATLESIDKRRGVNIINFAARQTKKGLTAKIKREGGRVLVSGKGFIGNAGRTAFKRVGPKRLPIKALSTLTVPGMFNTRRIKVRVTAYILKKFPEVFAREAAFYTRRFNGR